MKVSINWLKELVNLNVPITEVERLLPLRTIGTKEITEDFIELDMKGYNRADLLSIRGVALEISAITDSKLNFSVTNKYIWEENKFPEVRVKVEDTELAPLYCIAKIEGLKVSKSPEEWVSKLSDCGVRSINNVADITNLMMLEYGQPMHAFDASEVSDEALIVRTAKNNEEIITLDGKTRKLSETDLLITDSEKALGIAGVMGGKNSEVTDNTATILLEAAIFDAKGNRKTSQTLGLPSEASKRFQHGLTKKHLLQALDAAIKMYQGIGGKLVAISIVGNLEDEIRTLKLDQKNINSLIGVDISPEEVESSLTKLGFDIASQGSTLQGWEIKVPYFRLDIEIEADLIEEVARMHGYETIPAKSLEGKLPEKIDQSSFENISQLKSTLMAAGLTEVQTYSFYSTQVINNAGYDKNSLVKISNPISSETEYLRTNLWPNLVEVVTKNIKQGFDDIAIFEIGKTYQLTKSNEIQEEYKLCIALLNETDNPIQELYQILNTLDGIKEKIKLGETIGESDGRFHPTRYYYLTDNDKPVGKIGEVHPRVVNKFGAEKRVAILEIIL